MPRRYEDLTGRVFGRLLVAGEAERLHGVLAWECHCECGNVKRVTGSNLRSGNIVSCGCAWDDALRARTKHGMGDTAIHSLWLSMINRCRLPSSASYADYGGRGITVCDEWRRDFRAFYRDMGDKPEGKSLERRDNNGPYCKDNCYWATRVEQGNNKRNNRIITCGGETLTVTQWAERTGLQRKTIYSRLLKGWSPSAILGPLLRNQS